MEILDIINKFKNEFGFVENIDALVEYLKIESFNIEQINEILQQVQKYNQDVNKRLEKENIEFDKALKSRRTLDTTEIYEPATIDYEPVKINFSHTHEVDISYYKIQVDNCEDISKLEDALPKRASENFEQIINYLLISLLQEEISFRQLLYNEGKRLESDAELYSYVKLLCQKFEFIKSYRGQKAEQVIESHNEASNKLVFLTTNYGNVCALSDVKDIDSEYYETFLKLLESIIDGTFKNVKTFVIPGSGTLVSEVKDFKTRVIFIKLEPNVYIVNSIFVKKTDIDQYYRNSLNNRDSLYRGQIGNILKQLAGPNRQQYLEEQSLITEELINIFKGGEKVKRFGDK